MGPGGFNDAKSENGSSFAAYNKRSGPVKHVDKLLKGSLKRITKGSWRGKSAWSFQKADSEGSLEFYQRVIDCSRWAATVALRACRLFCSKHGKTKKGITRHKDQLLHSFQSVCHHVMPVKLQSSSNPC